MSQIHITINGVPCTCEAGTSILHAAQQNGIEIPYPQVTVHQGK